MTTERKVIRAKIGLLELGKQLGDVSQACKVMGCSRDSCYHFQELHDKGGEVALAEMTKCRPAMKNRVDPAIEQAIAELAVEQPALGQVRIASELRKRGMTVSPAGVRCVWRRHDLGTMKKRLKALEARSPSVAIPAADAAATSSNSAQEGLVLAEAQVTALRRAKLDKEARGEFESECPGCCGARGHLPRRHPEGRGTHLPADLHRHLQPGGLCQALRPQGPDHRSRPARRPRGALLRPA